MQYNYYLMDLNDHIVGRHEHDCADDPSAMLLALALKSDFEIEVWQSSRLIGRLSRSAAKAC